MKNEYDFAYAERGKFYRPGVMLNTPINLEADNMAFVEQIAARRQVDVSRIVNDLIKGDRHLAEIIV
jgi:hypothetical protein